MHPESARDRDPGLPLDPDTLPPSARPYVADVGLVAVGGSLGTGLRYGLGAAIPHWGPVPIATFGINVVGAFVLGWLLETLLGHERRTWARRLRLGVGTGVLGGFTTYSALATDTAVLLGTHPGLGVAYAVATVGLGGVASVAGIWAARGAAMSAVLTIVGVCLAGGVGAALRFVLDGLIRGLAGDRYPLGTTVINLTGSLVLGLITGLAVGQALPETAHVVVGTGLLGGYTTFSTASFETVRLLEQRRWGAALANGLGRLVLATLLAAAGCALGAALTG